MLSLHSLHGAPVLAGALSSADAAALRAAGAELLVLPPGGLYVGLEWCGAPPPGSLFVVFVKDYSDAEMRVNVGGAASEWHRGWTLDAFVLAYAHLCDGARILSSPAAAVLREAGVLTPAAVAALGGPDE